MSNYIIDYKPFYVENIDYKYMAYIEDKILNKESITNEEANDFLATICFITRFKINKRLNNYDYKCDLAQSILCHYLKQLECFVHPVTTQETILPDVIEHSFTIIQLLVDGKLNSYLLDPTYIQFFRENNCIEEKYFYSPKEENYILVTPDPGYFIKDDEKEMASFLLNYGFINLNKDTARMYGDSFYNTKTGRVVNDISYNTMSGDIYLKAFLKGKEKLSKTQEELVSNKMNIPLFKDYSSRRTR